MPNTHHNGVERDMTAAEIAEYESTIETVQAEKDARQAEAAAREALRSSALAKLGLTADEVAALFG